MRYQGIMLTAAWLGLLSSCLVSTVEAQTQAYLRGTGRVIATPAVRAYQPRSYPVSHSRKYYGPSIEEPVPMADSGYGCRRCCPAIIPTLLKGINSALDCLLPCRPCGLLGGCNDCGKGPKIPSRSYRPAACACPLGVLPIFSRRFHQGHGAHCGCYSHSGYPGTVTTESIPQEATPQEAIPKPVPEEEKAPRSARRYPTREELQRNYRPSGSNLRLSPPRAATPRSLEQYGRIAHDRVTHQPPIVRTLYSRDLSSQQGLRTSSRPANPLRR